jgi:hypothetical protein
VTKPGICVLPDFGAAIGWIAPGKALNQVPAPLPTTHS